MLASEWIAARQGGKEDCTAYDVSVIYSALVSLGVAPDRIHVKLHSTTTASDAIKRDSMLRLRGAGGMRFELLEPSARTTELIPGYDLVILDVTTGIFEAVLIGVPVVIYGMPVDRAASISRVGLPVALNAAEFEDRLRNYDNDTQRTVFAAIAAALQEGRSLNEL